MSQVSSLGLIIGFSLFYNLTNGVRNMDFTIFTSSALQWILAVLLVGYVSYSSFQSVQVFLKFQKLSKEFKEAHKECETYAFHMYMVYLMIVLAVVCVILCVLTGGTLEVDASQLFYYRLAYLALAIVFVGQFFETFARRTILYSEDGMFYVDTFYRFRMITSYEERKGSIARQSKVKIGSEEILLPHAMAENVQEHEKTWKAAKKAAKKNRK